ncbi:MAG: phosphoribosylformylglycinamidine cyclo-ligase, partial [Chloroflexi bacterium]|nr:phosphoribosylformylglycinamidine cyclo-ligase [Chloroflexota bacterium]
MTSYASAGVDIAAADENVRRISGHVRSTHGPQVLGDFGAFAGLFHLADVKDPVLVA